MPNFAPWYRRDEYALMREIMEDRDTLPPTFDKWEENAESEQEAAKCEGGIVPVFLHPDEFYGFCQEKKISPNTTTASEFARSRGAATYSLGM
jgi:hypothetical protein